MPPPNPIAGDSGYNSRAATVSDDGDIALQLISISLAAYNDLSKRSSELDALQEMIGTPQNYISQLEAEGHLALNSLKINYFQSGYDTAKRELESQVIGKIEEGIAQVYRQGTIQQALGIGGATLVNFCAGCDATKAKLQNVEALYGQLKGMVERTNDCYKCAHWKALGAQLETEALTKFAELNDEIFRLKQQNELYRASRDNFQEEKDNAFSMLSAQNVVYSKLQRENAQLRGVDSCANCYAAELNAQNSQSQLAEGYRDARMEIARLAGERDNLFHRETALNVTHQALLAEHEDCLVTLNTIRNNESQGHRNQNNSHQNTNHSRNIHQGSRSQSSRHQGANRHGNSNSNNTGNRHGTRRVHWVDHNNDNGQ